MARQKFQRDAWCPGLRKCSWLREDTCPDKPWRCRALVYWARALPTADRFDRTTSPAPNFSSARSTSDISETLRPGIAAPVRRLFGRAELELGACRQRIRSL